jgi:predicted porin
MKKTLIALAAVAATSAFAQSSVTIYGTFDPSVVISTTNYANGLSYTNTAEANNSQGTTQVTFKGVEDLGGGLKASFLIENDFSAGAATGAGTATNGGTVGGTNYLGTNGGELYTGIEGGFGSIKLGAANTPSLTTQAGRQPFGTKIGGGFNSVLGTGHVREDQSIVYASPNLSGFSAQLGYRFGVSGNSATLGSAAVAAADVNAKTDLGLFYAAGPLSAGVTFFNQSNVNKQTNLFVSYVLGNGKVILGYHNEDQIITPTRTDNYTGSNIAGTYNFTPAFAFLGNYARLNAPVITPGVATLDKSILALGLKYTLSARTSVYARYVNATNDGIPAVASTAASTAVTGVKSTLFGIMHNF